MSVTLSSLRARVRANLDELDARHPIGVVYLDQQIRNHYTAMQARLPAAWSYTASAGTITASTATFTLPTTSSAEYAGAIRIQLASTLAFLDKVSQEEIQRLRGRGQATGRPTCFAPYEDSSQSVICWVYPMARENETYNLFRSLVAADTSSTDVAATTLAIGRIAQDALVFKVSAAIGMSPRFLGKIDADLRASAMKQAQGWELEGERLIYQEADRRHSLEDAGHIQRFVS